MNSILNHLFRNSTLKPQIGFAGADKVGKLWLPGLKPIVHEKVVQRMKLPLKGCTQLAFQDWFTPANDQECEVCWVGLDIDADDNLGVDLKQFALDFPEPISMARTSCSGKGIHLCWVLAMPIRTNSATAGRIVKNIAGIYKQKVEALGVHVCQANRRMFWFQGGKNETFIQSDFMLELEDVVHAQIEESLPVSLDLSPRVAQWVSEFQSRNILPKKPAKSNPIYVGDAVSALRELGEPIATKSTCRGNGQVNGYIDLLGNRIALWSYADGHTIWAYTDLENSL